MVGSTVTCAQPTGFYPNGLLPNESGSATRVLDPQIWSIAEERTAELIDFIQPNRPSEERRNAIACYVQRLISKCFSCQVFTFGSVPLKTYLPDGDIDVTAFSNNQNLKETWANEVRDILQSEEKSEEAEFRVKEVQYIQAEVKLIKCLVENIVVDISFNQLGGLCTLCFLEEVDSMISQNHLLKRSIILIKAWCYYESRILGAHHGLISTYALEILVLYIFHVFNNSFAGPLEVLYRFMEFFSKFDWDNYCISLWGPVPMSSLPHMIAEPPRKDQEELLLSQVFLRACNSVFTVLPGGLENNDLPFVSKFFNVIDPLRTNNNLGRSVSKGNFFRIRSAFAFGAQRLARLINCPKENIVSEVNQFFFNTLDRHGKGDRPDAPGPDPYFPQAVIPTEAFGDFRNPTKKNEKDNLNSDSHESDQTRQSPSISNGHVDARVDRERNNRSNFLRNEKPRARYQLARTNSSPELSKRAPGQIKKESKLDDCREEQTSFETLQMHQQEQDLVNMMASCRMQSFNGSVQMPPNLMPPSILAYSQRNGIISTSNSSFEPHWGSSMQYSHNLPVSQYISSLGPISNHGEEIEAIEDPKNVYGNDTNNALGSGQDDINSTRVHFSRKENRKWTGDSSDVNSQHPNMAQNFIKSRNSSRPKIPSDISSDGSLLKSSKSTRRWKKPIPSTEHSVSDKYEPQYEFNDDNSDWIPLTTADSETAESVVPSSESTVASSVTQAHQIHSYEPLQMNNGPVPSLAPNGSIPFDSRTFDNNGALPFTIYQMAPPFFVTMLPFFGNNTANSDSDNDKEFNNVHNSQYGQQLNLTESVDLPESSGEHKADILNGDYRSHFQNLIHGRRCQYPLDEGTMLYQSPGAVAATAYHFPGDGPTRPLSANANLFNQLMGYGGGVTPLLPLHQHQHQHQQYSDDIPRYRAGTGTYLPNPRISRDRQSSNLRNHRGNYSNDRKDHHADRDGNWNVNKQRFVARNQGCNQQFGRLNARVDRPTQNKRRFDRAAWEPETSHPNHHGHDGQFAPSKLMHQSATNLANGMHPLPVMNPNGVSPAGSFVMLYPYDKNPDFSSNGDNLLEIGPSGPIQYDENSSPRLSSEQQNLLLNSTRSSPDPPGSPIHRRRV